MAHGRFAPQHPFFNGRGPNDDQGYFMHHVRTTDGVLFCLKSDGFRPSFKKQKAVATRFRGGAPSRRRHFLELNSYSIFS
jgi:hypothetical protein